MSAQSLPRILFLALESPWPAHSGARLRSLGLLGQLRKFADVEVLVLTRYGLTAEQKDVLSGLSSRVTRLPLLDTTPGAKAKALTHMLKARQPYHPSLLRLSLGGFGEELRYILGFPGIVVTSTGTWGTLIRDSRAQNWVLNQCDADVDFWRVYAASAANPLIRLIALMNHAFAKNHYPRIYQNSGRVISVCEDDRQLTLKLAPTALVEVIENGVDCKYYCPAPVRHDRPPRFLFAGTSSPRNIKALRRFTSAILPLIQRDIPEVELVVGGNFSSDKQTEFKHCSGIRFTGRIEDIRPVFNSSDVFVAPFTETHGSKLKIAQAMAMAMPIVSTPQGVRGFPLSHGESVFVAENDDLFASHCIDLLRNASKRKRLGNNAREVAMRTLDWDVLGVRLQTIIRSVASNLAQF